MSRDAAVVLDMMSAAYAAIDAGRSADAVVCEHLGAALRLEAAVVVLRPIAGGAVVVASWPHPARAEGLVRGLLRQPVPPRGQWGQLLPDPSGTMVRATVGPAVPAAVMGVPTRTAAFSRQTPFSGKELRLWATATRPLAVLWGHLTRIGPVSGAGAELDGAAGSGGDPAGLPRAAPERSGLGLTDRESQVLELLAQGLLATSIASHLGLSPRTVHKHLGNVYRKLGVSDRLLAVRRAEGLGLLGSMRAS